MFDNRPLRLPEPTSHKPTYGDYSCNAYLGSEAATDPRCRFIAKRLWQGQNDKTRK